MALIVAGAGAPAHAAHRALFEWLCRHRAVLSVRVFRFAWVIEDDTIRACAEAWQGLLGNRLFGVEASIFREVKPALSWLLRGDLGAQTHSAQDEGSAQDRSAFTFDARLLTGLGSPRPNGVNLNSLWS
jgi:hypothetical protein